MDAHLPVGHELHGVVGEGGPQQVPADALEAFAVATVDDGVKLNA